MPALLMQNENIPINANICIVRVLHTLPIAHHVAVFHAKPLANNLSLACLSKIYRLLNYLQI